MQLASFKSFQSTWFECRLFAKRKNFGTSVHDWSKIKIGQIVEIIRSEIKLKKVGEL